MSTAQNAAQSRQHDLVSTPPQDSEPTFLAMGLVRWGNPAYALIYLVWKKPPDSIIKGAADRLMLRSHWALSDILRSVRSLILGRRIGGAPFQRRPW